MAELYESYLVDVLKRLQDGLTSDGPISPDEWRYAVIAISNLAYIAGLFYSAVIRDPTIGTKYLRLSEEIRAIADQELLTADDRPSRGEK